MYKLYREPTEDDESRYPIFICQREKYDDIQKVINAHLSLDEHFDESMFYITGAA